MELDWQERFVAWQKYHIHKSGARQRGIGFELTFLQWLKIWTDSGHWHERGRGRGKYHMARHEDKGPYAVGNVSIITHEANVSYASRHKPRRPYQRYRKYRGGYGG